MAANCIIMLFYGKKMFPENFVSVGDCISNLNKAKQTSHFETVLSAVHSNELKGKHAPARRGQSFSRGYKYTDAPTTTHVHYFMLAMWSSMSNKAQVVVSRFCCQAVGFLLATSVLQQGKQLDPWGGMLGLGAG